MGVDREDAIRLAIAHANANGYRVVRSFDGLVWVQDPLPVKFEAAHWADDHWSVLFEKLLPPEIEFECPGAICVHVDDDGRCNFFALL